MIAALLVTSAVRLFIAQRELKAGLLLIGEVTTDARDANGQLALGHVLQEMPRLAAACDHVHRGHALAQPYVSLLRPLGLAPGLRSWGELESFLEATEALCSVHSDVQAIVQPLAGNDRPGDLGPALLGRVATARPLLDRLATDSGIAADRLNKLRPSDFGGRLQPLGHLGAELQRIQQPLKVAHDYAPQARQVVDALLGGSAGRTYLIVAQDNAEMRATGGFVGVMGPMDVSGGRVTHTEFRSSYDWDDPTLPLQVPPQPLQRYMNSGVWFIRDANWWPDFQQTAAQFEASWTRSQPSHVDGIIAVDLYTLDDLLKAVDGVDVPELGGHVTAGTAEDEIEKRRYTREALASYLDYQRTKTELLGALYRALLAKLLQPPPGQLARIADAVLHDLETKHLLLSFADAPLADLAAGQGWDGRVRPDDGSSVAIIDTEMSYGKLGPYMTKSAAYEASGGRATLNITYSNSFRPNPGAPWDPFISGLYWDWRKREFVQEQGAWLGYIRVAVPTGSRLEAAVGWDDQPASTDDVPGFTTFAAPVLVHPGDVKTLRLEYQLPPGLDARTVTAIAQPGAKAYRFQARLPSGSLEEVSIDGRDVKLGSAGRTN